MMHYQMSGCDASYNLIDRKLSSQQRDDEEPSSSLPHSTKMTQFRSPLVGSDVVKQLTNVSNGTGTSFTPLGHVIFICILNEVGHQQTFHTAYGAIIRTDRMILLSNNITDNLF